MKIRSTSSGRNNREEAKNHIAFTAEDMTNEQYETMMRFLHGLGHVRYDVEKGEIIETLAYRRLPAPADDPDLALFWPGPSSQHRTIKMSLGKEYEHCFPSILIHSLCGYGWTLERYQGNAARLESYGFHCVRSQRDREGRYWEYWVLTSLWGVAGDLKNCIESSAAKTTEEKLKCIISFLCRSVSFGSLEVARQYAAMVIE